MKALLILSLAAVSLGLSSCANCCKSKSAACCKPGDSKCATCDSKKKM
ncbi:hypothetical protein EI77_03475 [Prosthecobacter fusiformis]|uniref:Uncharacterized protein n=1 Tax=Prosthecobacter fusiformis TaxID=48464 RepID=A0A4V3FEK5_9BACT|nr:hypothetical protein [Prosthecobacter fusiformis]TDU67273.1 hypothetical protein EI77_03475 [Prosthecobacter fusiformis]